MPELIFAPDALRQLRKLRVYEQRIVVAGIKRHLIQADPTRQSRNNFCLRRESRWADFELMSGNRRVFYRVSNAKRVTVSLIGVKRGNRLLIEGKEFQL